MLSPLLFREVCRTNLWWITAQKYCCRKYISRLAVCIANQLGYNIINILVDADWSSTAKSI